MSNCNNIDKVLNRNGTDQKERFIPQLDPSYFKLNDFDVEDWILFTYNFAKKVNYFNVKKGGKKDGDWQNFFNLFDFKAKEIPFRSSRAYKIQKKNISKVLEEYKEKGTLTPHLTLFVCFLQLLEQSKKRFNGLNKRHLDFYYKNILKLDKLEATPDSVHVIFELAKKSTEEQIPINTELNGKKDVNGLLRKYKTEEKLIANQAKVESLKTIYNNPTRKEIKASSKANTLDGINEPLPEDELYWFPFGYSSEENKFAKLPNAKIGFAIASPLFLLKEGNRTVNVTFIFDPDVNNSITELNTLQLKEFISISASGEEKWIESIPLVDNQENISETEEHNKQDVISLSFELSKEIPAIVPYNNQLLLENYNTNYPVVRFLIDISEEMGYSFHKTISNRVLKAIHISVDVKEAKAVSIENDIGVLAANKPFFPFTSQPVKGSNFYINYNEVFLKEWNNITVNFSWKNAPDSFNTWYNAYKNIHNQNIVENESYFKVKKELFHKESWETLETSFPIFNKDENENYNCRVEFINNNNQLYKIKQAGPIRLQLETSFLHEQFTKIYTAAILNNQTQTEIKENNTTTITTSLTENNIPNPAYTPLAENITINYTAKETRKFQTQTLPVNGTNPLKKAQYNEERIKLFHIHPFGQCEEHNYLKIVNHIKGVKDVYDSPNISSFLLPKYCNGGELFIGLKNVQVKQNIALLVQLLEGSENPTVNSFEENEKIQWAVLCNNQWKSLNNDIITNSTDNFLSSGIVKFKIPKQATQNNTRLPNNYVWIRAKMHRAYNAVCKAVNIHTQAVLATFENNDNELSHLNNGLEAESIKKLINRIPQVKGVLQPYSSFNGIPEETDAQFYRRISERLRHKNRAITLWDYEHLILQKFPEIYKIKCLNHTYIQDENDAIKDNYTAAGHVTLVVIPDTVNKNVFNIYQPRVSKGLLNKIKAYINKLNSPQVVADVINPRYEEIKINLDVKFLEGYDENFYTKKLDEDIIKFLSPWAFNEHKEVKFGIDLHKSILIDYIEKLSYIDYLQNVVIKKDDIISGNAVSPSNPRSILVSAKKHHISTVLKSCNGIKKLQKLVCQ